MIYKLILLLLLIVSMNACAFEADCNGSFRLGSGFSEQETTDIATGVSRLNTWMNYQAVTVSTDGICLLTPEGLDGDKLGNYKERTGTIRLDTLKIHDYPDQAEFDLNFQGVVMHELLHSFGLEHIAAPGVMNAEGGNEFTEADHAECVAHDACR